MKIALYFAFIVILVTSFLVPNVPISAQDNGWVIGSDLIVYKLNNVQLNEPKPLFSVVLDGKTLFSHEFESQDHRKLHKGFFEIVLDSLVHEDGYFSAILRFENHSKDTLTLENLVPFGEQSDHVYITGKGKHPLSRSHLFRSGLEPVNVILPDNSWELGLGIIQQGMGGFAALSRRKYWNGAVRRRFETLLPPGSSVTYRLYIDAYHGVDWQDGLRKVFQEKYLYDLKSFDNTLYLREDLQWIRKSYAMHLLMAWDNNFYNTEKQEFSVLQFEKRNKSLFGGNDVIGIWPTWPMLGLDQRNQWDMYRDLPGGLPQLAAISDSLNLMGTKFFIAYNPWDESTRLEGHLEGMSELIQQSRANGVVLDTKGSSSRELQEAADAVSQGIVMYSEGMAVPKDMPGIVSGRVHNALYYPPLLNLNKFIKPDFAIFRVAELAYERIRREYALSMFNGYGTELNVFRPGRPEWAAEDYRFFGRTLRVLRENHPNFISYDFIPLFPTIEDGIYVNRWAKQDKILYTIFSLRPEGYHGRLFEVENPKEGWHYIDIWSHEELIPEEENGKFYINVNVEGFDKKWLGSNNEGAVSCIIYVPELLEVKLVYNKLKINALLGSEIRVWAGVPEYGKSCTSLSGRSHEIDIKREFGTFEGKLVIQLFEGDVLLDERVVNTGYGIPRLISIPEKTKPYDQLPEGMVKIPSGTFTMKVTQGDQFIPYPVEGFPKELKMSTFFMDRHPFTNLEFKKFLDASGYWPLDDHRFLAHWDNGKIPVGKENFPVVNVSWEDAKAFAAWAGKRLPTEAEWQYAASAGDGRDWPWDKELKVNKRLEFVTNTLTVEHLEGLDKDFCNLGNGEMDPVGNYPKGRNPWGLEDLTGSVWQLTADLYDNSTNQMLILKGGSYFKPSSSWWYVQGGPRETHYRQMLLRVAPGFERNETVGFRCVADSR
ncbi:formylglycine-generating enzyme family protein [Cecembia calidifontis]|uniref:Formylglycine-generating enzyme required for sulfatase activity n=1 Tax=Cecembia calidifontis TaxID=1187080 RepID=A0A4Q7PC49_9BACT|nr:SUMF1/EgtB/PvdO family nonheme iron enzyme [Cecembia calidifontis]RZS97597.1 formylglycine-generating enzyme required for sulfatase activity [Cecembia calidifontis]